MPLLVGEAISQNYMEYEAERAAYRASHEHAPAQSWTIIRNQSGAYYATQNSPEHEREFWPDHASQMTAGETERLLHPRQDTGELHDCLRRMWVRLCTCSPERAESRVPAGPWGGCPNLRVGLA